MEWKPIHGLISCQQVGGHFVGADPTRKDSADNGVLDWRNLAQPPPRGIGRDVAPGETLTVTLAFDLVRPLTAWVAVENRVTVGELQDVYGNRAAGCTV
ncbi:MAG TPA: hypothetical protein ENN99_12650, partial [Chloroflexi bacterium]|nr:hypothetical protein [Chloroflexota bacterium]